MNMKKLASIMGIGLGLSLAAGPANSISISQWSFQDDNIEFVLRKTGGNYVPITSGPLQVGDVLWAIVEIPTFTINGGNAIPAGKEVTGVVGIELTNISPDPGGVGTVYTFGAFGDFQSVLSANGGPNLPISSGNPAIALFINNATSDDPSTLDRNLILDAAANPASNCTSLFDCTREATQGSLLQVDGFGLDKDEFWEAIQVVPGGGDIGIVHNLSNTTLVASYNFALSNLFNTQQPVCSQNFLSGVDTTCSITNNNTASDGWFQVLGSGSVLGGQGLTNGAIAHGDFDTQKYVPEPAALALFGIGLVGLGARFRRTA